CILVDLVSRGGKIELIGARRWGGRRSIGRTRPIKDIKPGISEIAIHRNQVADPGRGPNGDFACEREALRKEKVIICRQLRQVPVISSTVGRQDSVKAAPQSIKDDKPRTWRSPGKPNRVCSKRGMDRFTEFTS